MFSYGGTSSAKSKLPRRCGNQVHCRFLICLLRGYDILKDHDRTLYHSQQCMARHKSSSERRYSPTSLWWKTTTPLGSILRQSLVDLAVTPNPARKVLQISLSTYHAPKWRRQAVGSIDTRAGLQAQLGFEGKGQVAYVDSECDGVCATESGWKATPRGTSVME